MSDLAGLPWLLVALLAVPRRAQDRYRVPLDAIRNAVLASPPPSTSVAPGGAHVVVVRREAMPWIALTAQPRFALSGFRIDADRNPTLDTGRRVRTTAIAAAAHGSSCYIVPPANADVRGPIWTADGTRFAYTNANHNGLEVWFCGVSTAKASGLDGIRVSDMLGAPVD